MLMLRVAGVVGLAVLGRVLASPPQCRPEPPWHMRVDEYVVVFDSYASEAVHSATVAAATADLRIQAHVRHRAPAYPTDFVLWQLRSPLAPRGMSLDPRHYGPSAADVLTSLRVHTNVKSLSRNTRLSLAPQSMMADAPKDPLSPSPTALGAINGIDHVAELWARNITGQGVKVGIFDTGLAPPARSFFHHVHDISNWTDEDDLTDANGHGTFVAGVIGGAVESCPGLAPDAALYVFRVFSTDGAVYTSWFLDAINYALFLELDVLNFSIGGPDFRDMPFVDKVAEASAHGLIVVSAAGNTGPYYGVVTNPADQVDVIGVGGLTADLTHLAPFSSRGLTTWEIDVGYGRVKPDVVALAENVLGPTPDGTCTALNGTSMAAPLVSGAIALLLSAMTPVQRLRYGHVGFVKSLLLQSASRLPSHPHGNSSLHNAWHHIYEQGAGRLNLTQALASMEHLMEDPRPTLLPASLDLTDCPYMWPHCRQAFYFDAIPIVFNVTVVHPTAAASSFASPPEWLPGLNGDLLTITTSGTEVVVRPYTGAFGVFVSVAFPVASPVVAEGRLRVTLTNAGSVDLLVRIPLQPTPPKHRRILWDQFRNLQYPSAYIPKDDVLGIDPFDNHGDHMHTNFADLWLSLIEAGYAVEIATVDYTCLSLAAYGALLVVDPEEPWFEAEHVALRASLEHANTSLFLVGGWYNEAAMAALEQWDANTLSYWRPVVGGANVPGINALLAPFGIAFGTSVWSSLPRTDGVGVVSSTSLVRFPVDGHVYYATLRNITDTTSRTSPLATHAWESVPILGHYQIPDGGRIVVMGDAACMDASSAQVLKCYDVVLELLRYATTMELPATRADRWVHLASNPLVASFLPVTVQPSTELWKQSKVMGPTKKPGECGPYKTILSNKQS
ncbi:hypothetical protein SDRG_13095 [Saprolegnia diclina VS20]|uniref:subtilisin n=1 Tax=Saprolegnia diclina (strain VS20) TaxID=1156394 RepID=T0RHC8_SAPDV|nr:hypothetical protein SDRG_13095 [Saprolegnia diclina VS20]EQC29222.1 hypothetical protein SDRG_13095 [Saprolegnia diclina VS20]|eukprot:XP_008617400.1 hypothetical protein SDRG_13095 [Saprolegnia diclina VS20]